MRLLRILALAALVIGAECIQFKIPQVDAIVGAVLSDHVQRVHFAANATNATAAVHKRQSSTYWYENINHQGISAFGPSGYQVFRNVKSFGAKGTPPS